MQAVTGRDFASFEAIAPDFACFMISHRIYPGITPKHGDLTAGRVYLSVDSGSFQLLDLFEDKVYSREIINVIMCSGGSSMAAHTYMIPPEHQDILSDEPWNRQRFIETHLCSYLESCRNFHQRISGQGRTTHE